MFIGMNWSEHFSELNHRYGERYFAGEEGDKEAISEPSNHFWTSLSSSDRLSQDGHHNMVILIIVSVVKHAHRIRLLCIDCKTFIQKLLNRWEFVGNSQKVWVKHILIEFSINLISLQ